MTTLFQLTTAQIIANVANPSLVAVTKELNDVLGANQVDFWMDAAKGVGHRVVHGHSLDNVPLIVDKFGWIGLFDYFAHSLRDVMSPHGMPIPFAREISASLGLRPLQAVDWLCLNIGELFSGGMSIAHSVKLFNVMQLAVEAGHLDQDVAFSALLGAVLKLGIGAITMNPLSIGVGIVDLGIIAWGAVASSQFDDCIRGSSIFSISASILNKKRSFLDRADGAFFGGLTTGIIASAIKFSQSSNTSNFISKVKKCSAAGAIGGVAGVVTSAFTVNPIAICTAAVGGYVAGEWTVERLGKGIRPQQCQDVALSTEKIQLPVFLQEAYC